MNDSLTLMWCRNIVRIQRENLKYYVELSFYSFLCDFEIEMRGRC